VSRDGCAQEFKDGSALLRARLNDGPDPFAPSTTVFASSSLRDAAVDAPTERLVVSPEIFDPREPLVGLPIPNPMWQPNT
jgi:hypothetical protein